MMAGEILEPIHLTIPRLTTAQRILLASIPGSIVYDTTENKLYFKNDVAVAITSWEKITSVEESE